MCAWLKFIDKPNMDDWNGTSNQWSQSSTLILTHNHVFGRIFSLGDNAHSKKWVTTTLWDGPYMFIQTLGSFNAQASIVLIAA